ncbi:MAG: RNA polymerase sigma factor [Acidimicrobiales bacterium]
MVDRTTTMASSTAEVLAARDGDRDAFARLVTSHMGLLHTVVRDHVQAPDDVADCVQETIAKALRNLHQLQDPDRFRPWLTSIARHIAIDHRRRRSRDLALSTQMPDTGIEPRCWRPTPEAVVTRRQLGDTVRARVSALPPREATAVALASYQDRTPAEIATALGVSVANAKVITHRGRRRLRGQLVEAAHAAEVPMCPDLDGSDRAAREHLTTCTLCHQRAHRSLSVVD